MELDIRQARLVLALTEDRLKKVHDPNMARELEKLRGLLESFLKSVNEL